MIRQFSRPYLIIAALRAISLVLTAWGVTQGIVQIINGSSLIQLPVLIALGGIVLRSASEWLGSVIAQRQATTEKAKLRLQLTQRVLHRGRRDIEQSEGELDWLGTDGLDGLDDWYLQVLPAMSSTAVIPLSLGIVMALTDWISALIMLLTLPLVPLFMWLIGTYTEDRVAKATNAITRFSSHVIELARGLPVLVGLHRAEEQTAALADISSRVRERTLQTLRTAFLSSLALELISTLSVALVAVFVGVRLAHGNMSLADGLFVLLLAPECFTPLRQVGAAYHAAEDGTEATKRVRTLVSTHTEETIVPADVISVRQLMIRYRDRSTDAVQELTFSVQPGEIVTLAGPSGCGKSSVLAALAGVLTDGSAVTVRGEISGIDPMRVAWVPQHPILVEDIVADELALAGAEDIDRLLEVVNAQHLRNRHSAELSLGELRRVAMARALARIADGADTLLLDEPTAHLDAASAAALHTAIRTLPKHVRVVLVAHDAATRNLAHRVIVMGPTEDTDDDIDVASPIAATRAFLSEPVMQLPALPNVLRLIQPDRMLTAKAVGLGLIASLSAVALTALSGWLIVRASEQPPIMYLLVAIVGVRFFGIGRAVFRYTERLYLHDAILVAMSQLRSRVWASLAASGPRNSRWLRPGAALDVLVGQVDALRDLAPRVLLPPVVSVMTLLLAIIAVAIIDPMAGVLLIVGSMIAIGLAPWLTLRLDAAASSRESEYRQALQRWFGSVVAAAADLRGNGLADAATAKLARIDRVLTRLADRGAWSAGAGIALTTLAMGSVAALMLLIGDAAVQERGLQPRMLAVLVFIPLALIEPAAEIIPAVRQWPALQRSVGVVESVVATDSSPPRRMDWPIASLSARDLRLRWPGMSESVVDNLTFSAQRGDWVVLTGPSGSGKSTIMAALMGFLTPEHGTILANGDLPLARHRRVAWCPQEAHIFDSTIRGNLLLARDRESAPDDAAMMHALEVAGLDNLVRDLPQGLNTRVGPAGTHLSGGQRQRLAIARAVLADADIVLLDEPTAHLDVIAARNLLERLRRYLEDRIVIMITHNPSDIGFSDKVIRLEQSAAERFDAFRMTV